MAYIKARNLVEGRVYNLPIDPSVFQHHPGDEDTATILHISEREDGHLNVTYRLEYWSSSDGQSVTDVHRTQMHKNQNIAWIWIPRPDDIPL